MTGRHGIDTPISERHRSGTIDEDTCLRLLAQEHIGRLGLSVGGLPVILPVNYVLVGRTIYFRSEDGEKTRAAAAGSVACLEVDRFDRLEHTGWSVMATGKLGLASDEQGDVTRLPLVAWAVGGESHMVRLPVELLSGRATRHP